MAKYEDYAKNLEQEIDDAAQQSDQRASVQQRQEPRELDSHSSQLSGHLVLAAACDARTAPSVTRRSGLLSGYHKSVVCEKCANSAKLCQTQQY